MPCAHDHWIKKEERKKDERTHKHTITTIIQHTPPLTIPQSFNKRHAVRKKDCVYDEESFPTLASVSARVGKLASLVMHFVAKDFS